MQDRTPPGAQFDDFDNEVKLRAKRDHQYDWGSTPVSMITANISLTDGYSYNLYR